MRERLMLRLLASLALSVLISAATEVVAAGYQEALRVKGLLAKGDYHLAADVLLHQGGGEDGDPARLSSLGLAYLGMGRHAEAALALSDANRHGQLGREGAEALLHALVGTGRYREAVGVGALLSDADTSAPSRVFLALAHERMGAFEVAKNLYAEALSSSAGDSEARLGLARIALKAGLPDKAAGYLREVRSTHGESLATWLMEGDLEAARGHSELARNAYRRALASGTEPPDAIELDVIRRVLRDPATLEDLLRNVRNQVFPGSGPSSDVAVLRGLALYARHDVDGAIRELEHGALGVRESSFAVVLLAAMKRQQGAYAEAYDMMQRYTTANPTEPRGRWLKARLELDIGQPALALGTLSDPDRVVPEDAVSAALEGQAALALGERGRAFGAIARGLKLSTGITRLHLRIAYDHLLEDDPEEAMAALEAASRPPHAQSQLARAAIYRLLALGARERAAVYARDLVRSEPESAASRRALADALWVAGDEGRAREEYLEAIRRDPSDQDSRLGLAEVALVHGDAAEARAQYTAILEQDSERWDALVGMARIALRRGALEEAVARLRRVCEVHPGDPVARVALAQVLLLLDDASGALASAREALGLEARGFDALMVGGQAELALGDLEAAADLLTAAVSVNRYSPQARMLLARARELRDAAGEAQHLALRSSDRRADAIELALWKDAATHERSRAESVDSQPQGTKRDRIDATLRLLSSAAFRARLY